MDDYNFSISDSWSFENDVRSEESISHNSRDYTPEFTTDQIFETREDMLAWARSVGLKYGIVVVILNSAKLKGGKLPKCILGCERGGKYEPPRYLVDAIAHFNCEGHKYPSRLKPIEKQFVVDMANNIAPREILNILKQKDLSNTTGIKSVYNTIFANKAAKLDSLTPIQYVIRQLLKKDYLHQFLTNSDTNEITDIIWVHPMSLELSVNFLSVLIIDATYKTNEYRKSLLEVMGITSTWRTYSLMFTYLSNEREETLTWALDNLKNWMLQKGASMLLVFVSDRNLALMNAIEACFPTTRHILCIWHINQCVMKNCSRVLGPEWKRFITSWHSLINSSTPSSFEQKWQAMCDDFRQFPNVITYLCQTWLRSYKERFVSAWTDTYMHLESNSSQRAESAHAKAKAIFGRYHVIVTNIF
ncbi:protein FAR-RED IMPAIRED RESPONSE 1-like [Rhododendron vialii]|uniref:protein FAR-RED IMPAIRED RESPONSE 1-like n=1 Tax=Rhododendron vialii TaxID=182163 RepID=UPI00265FFB71|nr:protein FAR-RED IMPAIRED RESPONSE 1-like [Rhododendron vialii]